MEKLCTSVQITTMHDEISNSRSSHGLQPSTIRKNKADIQNRKKGKMKTICLSYNSLIDDTTCLADMNQRLPTNYSLTMHRLL